MTYFELQTYVFKRFSVLKAFRTLGPTLQHYAQTRARGMTFDEDRKPELFTMNIMPPLMTAWYHLIQKNLGDSVDLTIFDCSGSLDRKQFPQARVQKFLNLYAATKSDEFLRYIAKSNIGWICDDDMFILNPHALDLVQQELAKPDVASFSFRPRDWWHFDIDGKQYEPSSSYCIAYNRKILIEKEGLSLKPCDGNSCSVSYIGKEVKRYDTADYANEMLIRKGYTCSILPEDQRSAYVTGYSGMSNAVMLLWYFRTAEQMMEYLEAPEDKAWRGNTMFRALSGLLALSDIFALHEKITGRLYPWRSLPSLDQLLKLRDEKQVLLREGHTFEDVDLVTKRLHEVI